MSAGARNQGGAAFPSVGAVNVSDCGMTLRDYFASQALASMFYRGVSHDVDELNVARAYRIADAMLAERAKP